ncbi:MAG TPA: protein translocase subunit SecF [Acidimicrobiales bacterium]
MSTNHDLPPGDETDRPDRSDGVEFGNDLAPGARPTGGPVHPRAFSRLYRGGTSFDFVGRKRIWFALSSLVIVAGVISLGVRGLDLGIDFRGGTSWTIPAPGVTQSQVMSAVEAAGLTQPVVEILGSGSHQQAEVQADLLSLSSADQAKTKAAVTAALTELSQKAGAGGHVNTEDVGPTWGGVVTQHALIALLAFFAAVTVYISFRFEYKMALAALLAMVHDLLVTIGVYSLAGFQVTPDTVIAILTILGYSLYDTVVVFDRVQENTRGIGSTGRITYSEMINLSMNQTLARSINTSLVAILPVLAVLIVGAEILGATTLQDYGLALVVGLLSGAYSSIFIASPVLALLKEREPRYQAIRQRVALRTDRSGALTPAVAAAGRAAARRPAGAGSRARSSTPPALRPGGRGPSPAPARVEAASSGASGTLAVPAPGAQEVVPSGAPAGPASGGSRPGTGGGRPPARAAGAGRKPPPRAKRGSKARKRR